MDQQITALLLTAASTLVATATTEVWQRARTGFATLFGRGDQDREATAARRLDALAAEVEQAPADQRDAVMQRHQAMWQGRLSDLVEDDPSVVGTLRPLVDQLRTQLPAPQQQWIQNITASAPGATAQGVMFGKIINHSGPGASASEPA